MGRMTYAEAAAAASFSSRSSSNNSDQVLQQQQQQQQSSTGTSPPLSCGTSLTVGKEEAEHRKHGGPPGFPAAASVSSVSGRETTAAGAAHLVGASPGTVKLLKEQFERQGSDSSASFAPRFRAFSVAASSPSLGAADNRNSDDVRHWELLNDAQACAEMIQQLVQEKQQLQQQVDSLWSQKEAFRCANERISKVLLRQQQQQQPFVFPGEQQAVLQARNPSAAMIAAAAAAGATPRLNLARRTVNVVPSGCLTQRGPRRDPEPRRQARDHFSGPQQQQQKVARKSIGIPGLPPLKLGSLGRAQGGPLGDPLPSMGAPGGSTLRVPGFLTSRATLASSALKTPRRRFCDGGISARASTTGRERRLSAVELQEAQQHAAVEEALVASLRAMNLVGSMGLGGGSSSKETKTTAAGAGKWEFTPEAALNRCSSNPDKGCWNSTFLCVLKVEGTDFFLDAVPNAQRPKLLSLRSSSTFGRSSPADEAGEEMFGARIVASKDRAGVFSVCVRHFRAEDGGIQSFFRAFFDHFFYGIPSVLKATDLPPDQTLRHGLSRNETATGEMGAQGTSVGSDSGHDEDSVADEAESGAACGWDAVAFMYQKSIDALGNPVKGRDASPGANLFISTRPQQLGREGSGSFSWFTPSASSRSSSSNSSSSKDVKSNAEDLRRALPFSEPNQLLLLPGQMEAEHVFVVRAQDRRSGLMPLFHYNTKQYLHIHSTMGLVGLVPPVIQQEMQFRQQQKDEKRQQKKKARRRQRTKKAPDNQQQEVGGNSSDGSNSSRTSPNPADGSIPHDFLCKPCRIEMIPLADILLQQSVQRVLTTVQETVLQQQQQSLGEGALEEPLPTIADDTGSNDTSSGDEGSFDGIVPSEEGGDGQSRQPGSGSSSRRPLVPPLGIGAATATLAAAEAAAESPPVSQRPVLMEFQLDDEGVETDVEGEPTPGASSSSRCSSSNANGDAQAFYWPTSLESAKFITSKGAPAGASEGSDTQ